MHSDMNRAFGALQNAYLEWCVRKDNGSYIPASSKDPILTDIAKTKATFSQYAASKIQDLKTAVEGRPWTMIRVYYPYDELAHCSFKRRDPSYPTVSGEGWPALKEFLSDEKHLHMMWEIHNEHLNQSLTEIEYFATVTAAINRVRGEMVDNDDPGLEKELKRLEGINELHMFPTVESDKRLKEIEDEVSNLGPQARIAYYCSVLGVDIVMYDTYVGLDGETVYTTIGGLVIRCEP